MCTNVVTKDAFLVLSEQQFLETFGQEAYNNRIKQIAQDSLDRKKLNIEDKVNRTTYNFDGIPVKKAMT
ncbi:hypothetical protein A3Q56_01443 [Intoshia linei]|uniref:Uncharacterized protein n=1 Tax=Intoshia linei TaxID=1819745 RepID=A0A177BBM7_9BILA|nr:hypothetical protein A3Q56_01443 [Intoshia linei]